MNHQALAFLLEYSYMFLLALLAHSDYIIFDISHKVGTI